MWHRGRNARIYHVCSYIIYSSAPWKKRKYEKHTGYILESFLKSIMCARVSSCFDKDSRIYPVCFSCLRFFKERSNILCMSYIFWFLEKCSYIARMFSYFCDIACVFSHFYDSKDCSNILCICFHVSKLYMNTYISTWKRMRSLMWHRASLWEDNALETLIVGTRPQTLN